MLPTISRIKNSPYSLPALSGALMVLCQPPVSLFFLSYIALVPLLFSLERGENKLNFFSGLVSGVVCYTGLVYWVVVAMNTYGGVSIPFALLALFLLALYMALYTGCFAWLISYLEDAFYLPLYLTAPPLWVLLEYARGHFLSGFPWSFLAYSHYNLLPVIQIVSVSGTYFLSFLIVAVNCLVYFIIAKRALPRAYTAAVVILVAVVLTFGFVRLREPLKETTTVSIVQGNISQDHKFDEVYKGGIVRTYLDLTLRHGLGSQLVIWPETAMPFILVRDKAFSAIRTIPVVLSNDLVVGAVGTDREERFYNAAYAIGKKGQITGTYYKEHLVPFGEYTPLTEYIPFFANMSVAIGTFSSGPGHDPIETGVGRAGMLICFEGVFPSITVETVRKGADVLINLTNDAWYNMSSAPYQHFGAYIFRAVEADRYVLRAANTGISAIIDPRGRVRARTGLFTQEVLKGKFSPRHGQTIYVKYGDYFVVFCLISLCLSVALGFYRRSLLKGA
jgi:apolipoprotein N-acyltransferase